MYKTVCSYLLLPCLVFSSSAGYTSDGRYFLQSGLTFSLLYSSRICRCFHSICTLQRGLIGWAHAVGSVNVVIARCVLNVNVVDVSLERLVYLCVGTEGSKRH